jgi:hypothetical protein
VDAGHVLGVIDMGHVESGGLQYSNCEHVLLHLLADILGFAESSFGLKRGATFDEFANDVAARYIVAAPQSTDILLVQPEKMNVYKRAYFCAHNRLTTELKAAQAATAS